MSTREEVYKAIDSERDYQDSRWNKETTTSENIHSFEDWIVYMEDYLTEAKYILSRNARQVAEPNVCHIMRKVVAMGVNSLEQHGALHRKKEEKSND